MTTNKIFELLKRGADRNCLVYDDKAPAMELTSELIFYMDRIFEKQTHVFMEKVYLFYEDMPRVDRRLVSQILPELEIIFQLTPRIVTTFLDELNGSFPKNKQIIIMGYSERYDQVMLGSY